MSRLSILQDILDERDRQEALKAVGKFKFTCADAGISDAESYAILGEEFGEVGHEINEGSDAGEADETYQERLRKELIQVMAVAYAWVEKLDRHPSREGRVSDVRLAVQLLARLQVSGYRAQRQHPDA